MLSQWRMNGRKSYCMLTCVPWYCRNGPDMLELDIRIISATPNYTGQHALRLSPFVLHLKLENHNSVQHFGITPLETLVEWVTAPSLGGYQRNQQHPLGPPLPYHLQGHSKKEVEDLSLTFFPHKGFHGFWGSELMHVQWALCPLSHLSSSTSSFLMWVFFKLTKSRQKDIVNQQQAHLLNEFFAWVMGVSKPSSVSNWRLTDMLVE